MSKKLNKHSFSKRIIDILTAHFGNDANYIFENSPIIIYLNVKTKSADRGSKSRGSFANLYALYVLIEDYIIKNFSSKNTYSTYEGASFSQLLKRQRELPFGSKLQNHALNSRLNEEFKKYHPTLGIVPIIRDTETQRYWIHEELLKFKIADKEKNLSTAIVEIIDAYIATKKSAFESFINSCQQILALSETNELSSIQFIKDQLKPNVDARVFEIVSYAILKSIYKSQTIWIGNSKDNVLEESLILYKTGRTNANDGGIDFVMKPLGRFFQVTETVDANKYFLDIDKVQRFPMTFIVKSTDSIDKIEENIRQQAKEKYLIDSIVSNYMSAIEEIINVKKLEEYLEDIINQKRHKELIDEIIIQSKLEFNYDLDDIQE